MKKGRSADGLRQLHRLFHDLDYYYVQGESTENRKADYFEVTLTVSNMGLQGYVDANFESKEYWEEQKDKKQNADHSKGTYVDEKGNEWTYEEYLKINPKEKYNY